MPYGQALLVSVTFIEKLPPQWISKKRAAPRAAVRFFLPDTGEQLSLSESLAKSPTTLRGQMPYADRVRKVLATVTSGQRRGRCHWPPGRRRELHLTLRKGLGVTMVIDRQGRLTYDRSGRNHASVLFPVHRRKSAGRD